MKLAAMDTMWPKYAIQERIQHIAELGFEGIQFWLGAAELGFSVAQQWEASHKPANLWLSPRQLSNIEKEIGLKIVALGQYLLLGDMERIGPTEVNIGRRREDRIEDIKAMLSYVAEEGSGMVISESGGDPNKSEQWNALVDLINELVSHAEKVGAILAIEHASIFLIDTDDALLRLMKEINSKALRINFDPANYALTPPGNLDVCRAIKRLKDYIVVLHAKDAVYHNGPYGMVSYDKPAYDCPVIGRGKVPWKECLKTLKEIGYDGYLIIEHAEPAHAQKIEDPEEGVMEGKKYLEKMMANI